jgi:hypothetical protein
LPAQKIVSAGVTLNLAAGGLWNRTESDEDNSVGWQIMFDGDIPAYFFNHVGPVFSADPLDFTHNDQPFAATQVHGKAPHSPCLQVFVGLFDRSFNVLRVSIHASDDDQILQATRHEQLTFMQESEVTGPQVGT